MTASLCVCALFAVFKNVSNGLTVKQLLVLLLLLHAAGTKRGSEATVVSAVEEVHH